MFSGRSKLRLAHLHVPRPIHIIAWNKAPGNCVLINAMKKLLLVGFIFLVACQPAAATPTVVAVLSPTATIPITQTPVPLTDTPVPTPTIEFTPTPLPRFFTNEFDSPLADWSILQTGNVVYSAQEYADVRIDARFTNQAGSPASIGLICRYSDIDGWLEYNVYSDGTYSVLYGQWLADGIADYFPVLSSSSNAILPSGSSQEIGLICSGTTLSLLIDQTIIRSVDVSRFELAGGKVGVTASSFENTPVIAAFDWVKVSEP
jgi:hypothetical protein